MLAAFLFRRITQLLLVVWLIVTLLFFTLRLTGDPVASMLGPDAPPQQVEETRQHLGLDRSPLVQYLFYVRSAVQLDFGDSFISHEPALETVKARFPSTVKLTVVSFVIALVVGMTAGVISAMRRNSWSGAGIMALMTLLQGIPGFALGIFLIMLFSVKLGWLPSFGDDSWKSLVLPALTLAAYLSARCARLTRSALVEVLDQDFIRTARSKGLTESKIIARHALKNALIPVLTVLAIDLGQLLGGAIVIESVFAWPGIGRQLILSLQRRDYAVVQAIVIVVALSVVTINIVVDVIYTRLDPRIRL